MIPLASDGVIPASSSFTVSREGILVFLIFCSCCRRHLRVSQVVCSPLLSRHHGPPIEPGATLHAAQLQLPGELPVPLALLKLTPI